MTEQLPLFDAPTLRPPVVDRPYRLQIYDLTDPALLDAAIKRLNETPAEQWPSLELHNNMLISVKLRQMELSEIEAALEIVSPTPSGITGNKTEVTG